MISHYLSASQTPGLVMMHTLDALKSALYKCLSFFLRCIVVGKWAQILHTRILRDDQSRSQSLQDMQSQEREPLSQRIFSGEEDRSHKEKEESSVFRSRAVTYKSQGDKDLSLGRKPLLQQKENIRIIFKRIHLSYAYHSSSLSIKGIRATWSSPFLMLLQQEITTRRRKRRLSSPKSL